MLAKGSDPIETKHQAKTQAAIKGRTFESAALEWHKAMSAKWAPGHAKTVLSRLKTHVFPLIGARSIVDLDTHDLMQPLEAIQKRGTIDVALRVQNYLQSIIPEAKRSRQITANPAYDLEGLIKAPRVIHRPALPLSRLPELQERIDTYRGRALTRLTVMLSLHVFVRSSELRFARWSEFDLKRGTWEIPDTRPALDGVPFSTRGTKMAGDIHLVPLFPPFIAALQQPIRLVISLRQPAPVSFSRKETGAPTTAAAQLVQGIAAFPLVTIGVTNTEKSPATAMPMMVPQPTERTAPD